MRLERLDCPYCGGQVSYSPQQGQTVCYCSYCGNPIYVDDEVTRSYHRTEKEVRYIDEAKLLELQLQEEARLREEESKRNLYLYEWRHEKQWRITSLCLMAAIVLMYIIAVKGFAMASFSLWSILLWIIPPSIMVLIRYIFERVYILDIKNKRVIFGVSFGIIVAIDILIGNFFS